MTVTTLACCGIREVNGISGYKNAEEALKAFYLNEKANSRLKGLCHVVFSGAEHAGATYAAGFREYIRSQGLGTVTTGSLNNNPGGSPSLRPYFWHVDRARLGAWAVKQGIA